jgi:hypothetical protein
MAKIEYSSSGFDNLAAQFEKFVQSAQDALVDHRALLIKRLAKRVMDLTPVWEGMTLANWQWFVGAPESSVIQPVDDGPTGNTGKGVNSPGMALGSEPRRPANEELAMESLANVLEYRGLADIYLVNNADTAVGLEYGLLPTPEYSRNPHGMIRVAVSELTNGDIH